MLFVDEGQTVYFTETVYSDATGLPLRMVVTLNGLEHAPPDGTPSRINFDDQGRPKLLIWHFRGEEHRRHTDGPAKIEINPENGIHVAEHFKEHNRPSRTRDDPAVIVRDRESGEVLRTLFFVDGVAYPAPSQTPLDPEL